MTANEEGRRSQDRPAHSPQANSLECNQSTGGTAGHHPACTSNETSGKQAAHSSDPSSGQPSNQSELIKGEQKQQSVALRDKGEQPQTAERTGSASSEPSGIVAGAPASPTGGVSPPSAPSGSPPTGQPNNQHGPLPTGAPSGSPSNPTANGAIQPGPPPEGLPPPGHGNQPPPGSFFPGTSPPSWGYPRGFPPPGPHFPPHDMYGRPCFDYGHAAYAPTHGPHPRVQYNPHRFATPPRFGAPPPHGPDRPRPPHRAPHVPDSAYPATLHAPSPLFHGYQVRLSNVPPELTARDLAEAFGEVSQSRVESVDVLRDRAGRNTGIALVVFTSMGDAQNAVRRYNGGDLNGRRLEATFEGEVNALPQR